MRNFLYLNRRWVLAGSELRDPAETLKKYLPDVFVHIESVESFKRYIELHAFGEEALEGPLAAVYETNQEIIPVTVKVLLQEAVFDRNKTWRIKFYAKAFYSS